MSGEEIKGIPGTSASAAGNIDNKQVQDSTKIENLAKEKLDEQIQDYYLKKQEYSSVKLQNRITYLQKQRDKLEKDYDRLQKEMSVDTKNNNKIEMFNALQDSLVATNLEEAELIKQQTEYDKANQKSKN